MKRVRASGLGVTTLVVTAFMMITLSSSLALASVRSLDPRGATHPAIGTGTTQLLTPLESSRQNAETGTPLPGRYIVVLKDSVKDPGDVASAQARQRGGDLGFVYGKALKGYSVDGLSRRDVETLERDPRVAYVAPDLKVETAAQSIPTGIDRIYATSNAVLDIDGQDDIRVDADVAVIDTGIDFEHPDLTVVARTSCVPPSEDWEKEGGVKKCVDGTGTDINGHGTHVAGTIGAIDNSEGVVGVAPGARLWAVKVLGGKNGLGTTSWLIAGIDWITAHPQIEVANMSLDLFTKYAPLDEALGKSVEKGIVYVAAAGNSGLNADANYPGGSPHAITVSALIDYDGKSGGKGSPTCGYWGPDDTLASFSNWGSGVELVAPGVCIYSTSPGGKYRFLSGTSMASPHVAGAAAILASQANPNSAADVKEITQTLIEEGSLGWRDPSEDSQVEPLLFVDDTPLASPEIATGGHSTSDGLSATLYGSVSGNGKPLEYKFEYGSTTKYGQSTEKKTAPGTQYASVSETITGLEPNQSYHYRLVATTAGGTFYGEDLVFTTSRWMVDVPVSAPGKNGPEWLNDISCATAGSCMAVGFYYKSNHFLASYRLAKGDWHFAEIPVPSGGIFPEANSVSCTSASACTAVGRVQLADGSVVPLVSRWDGTGWTSQTLIPPSKSNYAELTGVSCVSASECMAVGYYRNAAGIWANYSARWKSNSWEAISTPEPANSEEGTLGGISCMSASACKAVGWYRWGAVRPVILTWNGSSWSFDKPARSFGSLSGASCTSGSACIAVGPGPVVERWNGSAWASESPPLPQGSNWGGLQAASCATTSYCVAVGFYQKGPRAFGLVETWNGASWEPQETSRLSEAQDLFWGIGCYGLTGCAAVGNSVTSDSASLIETLESVSTEDATDISYFGATLNGEINPGGLSTTYHFEYGPTSAYGSSVPISAKSVGSGAERVSVSEEIAGLKDQTTYHYRLVGSNALGTVHGPDKIFKTSSMQLQTPFSGNSRFVAQGTDPVAVDGPNMDSAYFKFDAAPMECGGSQLTSTLNSPLEVLTTSATWWNCISFGTRYVDMNGCSFILHPSREVSPGLFKGVTEIGPAGCGPVKAEVAFGCKITIPPQNLAIEYENEGEGSEATIGATVNADGIKYTETGSFCAKNGATLENGTLDVAWQLGGQTHLGQPIGVWLDRGFSGLPGFHIEGEAAEDPAEQPRFEVELFPSAVRGFQSTSDKLTYTFNSGTSQCNTAELGHGMLGPKSGLTLSAQYSQCTNFGFMNMPITMNNCGYKLSVLNSGPPYTGTFGIECGATGKIEVKSGLCAAMIGTQELTGVDLENVEVEKDYETHVEVNLDLKGIEYTEVPKGLFPYCETPGTQKNGTLSGTFTLEEFPEGVIK